jgi:L-ascorbate metabolism protein UlaG (beta-lactamase superfamily)
MFWVFVAAGCSSGPAQPPGTPDGTMADAPVAPPIDAPPGVIGPLEVHFIGVQGWVLRHRGETVLTAPMYTRGSVLDVSIGNPVPVDTAAIDAGLAAIELGDVKAIVSGHAHYDHLMDVPHIMMNQAPDATLFANLSARHLLAAVAPDRAPGCSGPDPTQTIDRARVIALDDPIASAVDYRNCPELRPPGAPLEGSWVRAPGSNIRIYPICSVHPDQFLFIHFGEGNIEEDQCELPPRPNDWLEGHTLAYVIDFLDDNDQPAFRVFYQDSPTDLPIGHPPADVIADKAVDLALLCVGSTNQVMDHPETIVAALQPRFALSGHWEDFFQPLGGPPQPILFLDVAAYDARADGAMPGTADPPMTVDGVPTAARHVRPVPGTRFVVPPAP